jgi:Helix-turn-helix domain
MNIKDPDKPLLHARRPLGRPRKAPPVQPSVEAAASRPIRLKLDPALKPFLDALAELVAEIAIRRAREARAALAPSPQTPREAESRLLDVKAAAKYLGVSWRTVRELPIPRVRLEVAGGREVRRILFDRRDLDAWIERQKDRVLYR